MSPQEERQHVANALEDYMAGRIDNFQLDDLIEDADFVLTELPELWGAIWCSYDDFHIHPPNEEHGHRAHFRRVAAFLRSGLEYREPPTRRVFFGLFSKPVYPPYWPFSSQADWRKHRDLASISVPSPTPSDVREIVGWIRRRDLRRARA